MSLSRFDKQDFDVEIIELPTSPDGKFVVPEARLLFDAEFGRSGYDLLLSNDGEATLRVSDYFLTESAPEIYAPDGAFLRGDVIVRLAGPLAPSQYAQSEQTIGGDPIGQVETLTGGASVQRTDGSVEPLDVGMKIFQGDVIQTEDESTVSVTFVDGTIFTLASGSRMLIDELIFDPDGASNSAGFSLVQGSFVFIAGQVAKTGEMEVSTPSATMGIRGTTVVVEVETRDGVVTSEVTLTHDPDGDVGEVVLRDVNGDLIANITETTTKWTISSIKGDTREEFRSAQDENDDGVLIAEAVAAYNLAFSRFNSGDTFVTLGDPSNRSQYDNSGRQNGSDQEVDSIDEPGIVDPEEQKLEDKESDDGIIQEEGDLKLPDELDAPDILVAGLEDAGLAGAITGTIPKDAIGGVDPVFSLLSGPSNGSAVFSSDGDFQYVPAQDFNGVDQFSYEVTDTDGSVGVGTVTFQIAPVNDAPTLADATVSGTEDGTIYGSVSGTDVDGDILTYSLLTDGANGSVQVNTDGTFAYAPDPDFNGEDSFVLTVSDGAGESDDAKVTVFISAINDAPVIISGPQSAQGTVTEGEETTSVSGVLIASDADAGANLIWSSSGAGIYGDFTLSPDGAWTYTLDNSKAQGLSVGDLVNEELVATVSDEVGATATQVISVQVVGTNDAPDVTAKVIVETLKDVPVSGALTATDADSDGALTFSLVGDGATNGTVTMNSDGTYQYQPDLGFLGVDSFDYTVTDSDGGVSTASVEVEVESPPVVDGDGKIVSLSIATIPSDGVAAGSVSVDASAIDATSVNIVFALDRSGSIGSNGWASQVNAVADALDQLADLFKDSVTTVDVKIITYASGVTVLPTMNLLDPALSSTVQNLGYSGGLTNWSLALDETKSFLDSQPKTETNYLFFVTDGNPTSGDWQSSLSELTDVTANGYSVQIEAFGLGAGFNVTTLSQIDPTPTLLQSADNLADALNETPIFNPKLIDFNLSLKVDDVDLGVIAGQGSSALENDGLNYELAFAEIAGIETMLGESNRFSVTVQFDLDGDESTAEIELFSTEVIEKAGEAQILTGLNESDLLLGSDFADVIVGGGGSDLIFGFDGDDTLDGGTGTDMLFGGSGNDRLIVADLPDAAGEVIDGGAGRDILSVDLAGDLSSDIIPMLDISDVEAIDMENGLSNSMALSLSDVLGMSATADTDLETLLGTALPESVTIYGDSDDVLFLSDGASGGFEQVSGSSVVDANGNTLAIYQYVDGGGVLATLGVDEDITVVPVPVG